MAGRTALTMETMTTTMMMTRKSIRFIKSKQTGGCMMAKKKAKK